MTFHLTVKAKEDLRNIALYTQETWGIQQRDIYLKIIDDIFHIISEDPSKGRSCDEIRKNYYKFHAGKHVIFYHKFTNQEVQIVRILHASMDIPNNI